MTVLLPSIVEGLPSPRPRLVYSLPLLSPVVRGGFFLMAPGNRAILQRTWGLQELEARRLAINTNTNSPHGPGVRAEQQRLTYGQQFKYDEFIVMPNAIAAALFGIFFALGAVALNFFSPVCYRLYFLRY